MDKDEDEEDGDHMIGQPDTGANAGAPRLLRVRMCWAARFGQFHHWTEF
jgi:hypothetical protein